MAKNEGYSGLPGTRRKLEEVALTVVVGVWCNLCTCDDGICPTDSSCDCADGYNCVNKNYCNVCGTRDVGTNPICAINSAGTCANGYNCVTSSRIYCTCTDGSCATDAEGDCATGSPC